MTTMARELIIPTEEPGHTNSDGGLLIYPSVHQAIQSEVYTGFWAGTVEFSELLLPATEKRHALAAGSITVNVEVPKTQAALLQSEKVRMNAAKVQRNSIAVTLLAKLYDNRVLAFSEIGADCTWLEGAALAQLAGALLCDVDQTSIRITDYGVSFVKELAGLANS